MGTKGALADSLATKCELKKNPSLEGHRCSCRGCHRGVEKSWRFHHPWLLPCEDALEACNQSWEKGSLREDDGCQGEAGQDCREGIRCRCAEKALLREIYCLFILR